MAEAHYSLRHGILVIGVVFTLGACTPVGPDLQIQRDATTPVAEQRVREADRTYARMLRDAKANPGQTNWTALRSAYAASNAYDPAVGNGLAMHAIRLAERDGDYAGAAKLSRDALAQNWMNLPAHLSAATAARMLGDHDSSTREMTIIRGLSATIVAGHDGTSPQTAFPVLATVEEYIIAGASHHLVQGQALRRIDGEWYDILDVTRPPDTTVKKMYFLIDLMFARESQIATGRARPVAESKLEE